MIFLGSPRKISVILGCFIFSVTGFVGSIRMLWGSVNDLFWAQSAFASGVCTATFFVLFVLEYTGEKWFRSSMRLVFLGIVPGFLILSAYANGIILRVSIFRSALYGPAYWGFVAYFCGCAILGIGSLAVKWWQWRGVERIRSGIITIGTIIPLSVIVTTNIFLPSMGVWKYTWIGPLSTLILTGCILAAIIQYQFLELKQKGRIIFGHFVFGGGLIIVGTGIVIIEKWWGVYKGPALIVLIPVLGFGSHYIKIRIDRLMGVLPYAEIDMNALLEPLQQRDSQGQLAELTSQALLQHICTAFGITNAAVYVRPVGGDFRIISAVGDCRQYPKAISKDSHWEFGLDNQTNIFATERAVEYSRNTFGTSSQIWKQLAHDLLYRKISMRIGLVSESQVSILILLGKSRYGNLLGVREGGWAVLVAQLIKGIVQSGQVEYSKNQWLVQIENLSQYMARLAKVNSSAVLIATVSDMLETIFSIRNVDILVYSGDTHRWVDIHNSGNQLGALPHIGKSNYLIDIDIPWRRDSCGIIILRSMNTVVGALVVPEQSMIRLEPEWLPIVSMLIEMGVNRIRNQLRINALENRQSTIFNTLQVGLIILDNRKTIQFINQAGLKRFNLTWKECCGRSLMNIAELADFSQTCDRLFDTKKSDQITLKSGSKSVSDTVLNVMATDSEIIMVFSDAVEMTDALTSDSSGARLEKRINFLAASIAHDIKGPLTAFSNFGKMLKDPALTTQMREVCVNGLDRSVAYISKLCDEIMGLSKPAPRQVEPVKLATAIEFVLNALKDEISQNSVEVFKEISPNLTVVANTQSIEQILINIIRNSIHAFSEKSILRKISFDADFIQEHGYVRFTISDTACGIPADVLPKIFNPYFTTKELGTGLGLANVKRLVEQINGRISVASQLGSGTQFILFLPTGCEDIEKLLRIEHGNILSLTD